VRKSYVGQPLAVNLGELAAGKEAVFTGDGERP
jgi:hypothetical protein